MGLVLCRLLVVSTALAVTVGCGRIGYDNAPPIERVEIRSLDGTEMLQGESVRIEVMIFPREAAAFGRTITLSAAPGRLNGKRSIEVHGHEDGTPEELTLTAGMDVRDGRILVMQSDVPVMEGDLRYLVEAAPTVTVNIGPETYTVTDGLTLEAPLPASPELMGRTAALLMSSDESTFGPGPLVVAGDPFEVFDGSTGAIVPISTTGTLPTTGRIAQVALTPADSEYGEQIFVCVAGATGGLYSVASGGAVALRDAGGCNGVILYYDHIYFHTADQEMVKLHGDGATEVVMDDETGLPAPADGFFLGLCPTELFDVKMVLFSAGGAGVGNDGFAMAFEPWNTPRTWAAALAEPVAATYDGDLPFGTVMLVALYGSGELVALRDDGTTELVVGGLAQPTSVAAGPDGTVWLLDQGTDRLLRLRRALAP